jgi:hypothetical protein
MRNGKGADGNLQLCKHSGLSDELDLSDVIGPPKRSNERGDVIGQTFT